MLGDQRSDSNILRFNRTKDAIFKMTPEFWTWLCENAIDSLRLTEVSSATIFTPPDIHLPTVNYYRRTWTARSGASRAEQHECIRSGTVINFNLVVTTPLPGDSDKALRSPTEGEMKDILRFIGTYIGISPFGAKKNYGRFTLLELKLK